MNNLQQIAKRLNEQTPEGVRIYSGYNKDYSTNISVAMIGSNIIVLGKEEESYETIAKRWNNLCNLMSKSKVDEI